MQKSVAKNEKNKDFVIESLPIEERQRLVGAFEWLLQEDKKQNPSFYKLKKTNHD